MKTLLVLAILSFTNFANAADLLMCTTVSKVRPVVTVYFEKGKELSMGYTRTDNTILNLKLDLNKDSETEFSGTMWYGYYGDDMAQGTFKLSLPSTYGEGSLTYQFASEKSATKVALSCTGPDER